MSIERLIKDAVLATWSLSGGAEAKRLSGTYNLPDGFDRIYFWHIRKTAGTSINRSFLSLGGEEVEAIHERLHHDKNKRVFTGGRVIVGHNRYLIQQGYYFYAYSHHPMHEIKLPPRTFTMTCVRDPMKRVLSHYRMLVGLRRKKQEHRHNYRAAGTLAEYLEMTPLAELLQQVHMFSKALDVSEAAERIASCKAVLRTEHLSQDMAELAETLRLPLQSRHDRPSPDDITFDEQSLKLLREKLQPEYDLFERLKPLFDKSAVSAGSVSGGV